MTRSVTPFRRRFAELERLGSLAAIITPDGEWDVAKIRRFAATVRATDGQRFAIVEASGPRFVAALLAASGAGTTSLLLDPSTPDNEAALLLERFAPDQVIGTPHPDHGQGAKSGRVAHMGIDSGAPPASSEGPRLTFLTSGSTGLPKEVVHSEADLVGWGAVALRAAITWASTFSFHSMAGFTVLLESFLSGHRLVVLSSPSLHTFVGLMARHSVQLLATSPSLLRLILRMRSPELRDLRLSCVGLTGEPIAPDLIDEARERLGCEVVVSYGTTEAGPPITAGIPREATVKGFDVGKPARGVRVTIVGRGGQRLHAGDVGQIVCTMPSGKQVRTGDLGTVDSDGNVTLLGRADDMINVHGRKFLASEVESVLRRHPSIADAAVIADVPGALRPKVVAFIEAHLDLLICEASLREHCAGRLATFKVPTDFHLVEALPRTRDGKVARGRLRVRESAALSVPGRRIDEPSTRSAHRKNML